MNSILPNHTSQTINDRRFADAKRAAKVQAIERHSPRAAKVFRLAYSGSSRVAAVKAFCLDCNGYDYAAIKNCTAPACPLYLYRPGRSKAGAA